MITHLKNAIDRKAICAGFTLTELLAVVAIISILVAIAVPSLSAYIQKSKETVCISNRAAARRILLSEELSAQETTLQDVSETDTGINILSQCKCPSGGHIYVDGNTVRCTVHDDGKAAEKNISAEDPFVQLSASEKAGKFIELASSLGNLSSEILGNGDGSINKIKENINQMNQIIQNKKQSLSTEKLDQINKLAGEINTIATGLNGVSTSVNEKIIQLGTSIQSENLVAAGTYQGIINGYVKAGAKQADGETAANTKYPHMLNTLNTNLPTLSQVDDQLTNCREKIKIIDQKLSEINTLLMDSSVYY